jgi:hypothetical protein
VGTTSTTREVAARLLEGLAAAALLGACSSASGTAPSGNVAGIDGAVDGADDATSDGGATEGAPDAAADAPSEGDAAPRAAYGEPCAVGDDATCVAGLFCLQGPSGGTVGFCTKTCPATSSAVCAGTPPGTAAFCVVTGVDPQGDKGCAFVCRELSTTYTCPGALKCQSTDDPPGSGQYLCLP